jgi:hypothetical protein
MSTELKRQRRRSRVNRIAILEAENERLRVENDLLRSSLDHIPPRTVPAGPPTPGPLRPAADGLVMGALKVPVQRPNCRSDTCDGKLDRVASDDRSGLRYYICDTCQHHTRRIGAAHG